MEPQIQAKQKLIQIEADIGLAEREKTKALSDLERLNSTRADAFKQYDQQIQHKKDEVATLDTKITGLKTQITQYEQTVIDLNEKIVQLTTDKLRIIAETEQSVKSIHNEAEVREKAVTDRELNVKVREDEIEVNQAVVDKTLEKIQVEKGELAEERQEIGIAKADLAGMVSAAKEVVAKNREISDDIDRQIAAKKVELQTLDKEIVTKTETAKTIGLEAEARLKAVETREILVAGRERGQHEKDIIQNQREIKLNDRSATLRRAYREVLQRGGTVTNG